MISEPKFKFRGRLVVLLVAASVALSGCMNGIEGANTLRVTPAVQRNDPCLQFRAPFEKIRKERQQRIAGWAAAGAIVGAAATRGRDRNEVIGGILLGAIAGGLLGYIADVEKRSSTTAGFRSAVSSDARRDVNSTDSLLRSLSQLNSCRVREVRSVVADQRAGRIDKQRARGLLASIRQSTRQDNRIINSVVADLDRVQRTYVSALGQRGTDVSNVQRAKAAYKPRVTNPQRTAASNQIPTAPVRVEPRRTSNNLANLGYASKELDAASDAHADSIDLALDDAGNLFL